MESPKVRKDSFGDSFGDVGLLPGGWHFSAFHLTLCLGKSSEGLRRFALILLRAPMAVRKRP